MEGYENKKNGFKMDRKLVLWIVIAILVIAVIYVLFFKDTTSAQTILSQPQSTGGSGGMVGGC